METVKATLLRRRNALKAAALAGTAAGLVTAIVQRNPYGWIPPFDTEWEQDPANCPAEGHAPPPPPDGLHAVPDVALAVLLIVPLTAALLCLLSLGAAGGMLRATVHSVWRNPPLMRWLAATRCLALLSTILSVAGVIVANMSGEARPNPALHGAPCHSSPAHPQQCCVWRQALWTWPYQALAVFTCLWVCMDEPRNFADALSGAVVRWYFAPASTSRHAGGASRREFNAGAEAAAWRSFCCRLGAPALQAIEQANTQIPLGTSCAYFCLSLLVSCGAGALTALASLALGSGTDAGLLGAFTWLFSFAFFTKMLNYDLLIPIARRIRFCCVVERLAHTRTAAPALAGSCGADAAAAFGEQAAVVAASVPPAAVEGLPALVQQPDGFSLLGTTGSSGGPADIEASLLSPASSSE